MLRMELLEKLSLASAGLASNDLVPVLSHFWFTGTHVVSYNDAIGIQVPCKTDFKGAVPGGIMLSLLKSSKAKEVDLSVVDDTLLIKAASSRFKLGLMPPESFVWEMPKPTTVKNQLPVPALAAGIKSCLRSVSNDTSTPDQLGVTLLPNGGTELYLFSINGATISYVNIKLPQKAGFARAVLPTLFCQQMVYLSSASKEVHLEMNDDYALVTCKGISLYGRLVDVEKPIPFLDILKAELPKDYKKVLIPMPSKIQLMLERAIIVTDSPTDPATTDVTVKEGRMKFFSKSSRGEVIDTVQVEKPQKDVALSLDCKHLKNGYGSFDKMLITDSCFIMAKGDSLYLVTAVG